MAKSLPSFIVRAPSSGLLLDVHYDDFGGTLPAHPQEPLDLRVSGFGEMRSTADWPGLSMPTTFFKSFCDNRLAGPSEGA